MRIIKTNKQHSSGFTIVELLIVIVVIGILAAITIVAFNGMQTRAQAAKRDSDMSTYYKAILMARENTGQVLGSIVGSNWSVGFCVSSGSNPDGLEPKDLPKTHSCWTHYYHSLDAIGAAAEMDLSSLRDGDARGNPYSLDANEGEGGSCTYRDSMVYFRGSGTSHAIWKTVPFSGIACT